MRGIKILCGLFPDIKRKEIQSKSIGAIQFAADALQWAIVNGLDEHTNDLKLVNLMYIGSYPSRYKDFKINPFKFSHKPGANDDNVGFINLPLYKLYSRYINACKQLKQYGNLNEDVLLVYAMHMPFIMAALNAKKINPGLKICLIVPDLPEFMGDDRFFLINVLKKIESFFIKKALLKVDAFVLLSPYMNVPLNVGTRPWVCVEGVYNEHTDNFKSATQYEGKNIFYSGTLDSRYGILNLLNAFSNIKHPDYNLWICGDGNCKQEIINRSATDPRIKFYGQKPREWVLDLQKKATVLINPRTSEGEFTKYSFPSKTIEYLASGVPTIIHKLPGIPEEYFKYCFIADKEDAEGIKNKILEVCEMEKTKLKAFGLAARNFILENKNAKKQCEKIYDLINKL
jgi:glycosyltransferase involved in cell wall biosynthesis